MSLGELVRWQKYEAEEPFLGYRIELLGGLLCSLIANVNRGKNSPAFSPEQFMPFLHRQREAAALVAQAGTVPQNDDDAQVMRLVLAFGGKIHG